MKQSNFEIFYETRLSLSNSREGVRSIEQQSTNVYTMDQELADAAACAGQTLCVHRPHGSSFMREMTSWPPIWTCDVKPIILLRQSMRIYLRNIPAKFRPDPTWRGRALGFLNSVAPIRTTKTTVTW